MSRKANKVGRPKAGAAASSAEILPPPVPRRSVRNHAKNVLAESGSDSADVESGYKKGTALPPSQRKSRSSKARLQQAEATSLTASQHHERRRGSRRKPKNSNPSLVNDAAEGVTLEVDRAVVNPTATPMSACSDTVGYPSEPQDDDLPLATLVFTVPDIPRQGDSRREQQDSIPIATKAKRFDCFDGNKHKKLILVLILVSIVLLCGLIVGVVYVTTQGGNDEASLESSPANPTPQASITMSPSNAPSLDKVVSPTLAPSMNPTSPPTRLVLEQVGQGITNADSNPVNPGPKREVYFGWSIDMSADGSRLAVAAPYHNAVYIYDLHDGVWVQTGKVEEAGLIDHVSLSANGSVLAIGVPQDSEMHENGGKVQAFMESSVGVWNMMGDPIYGQAPGDRIGGFIDDDQYPGSTDYYDDDFFDFSIDSYDSSSMALSENGQIMAIGSPRGNYVLVFFLDETTLQWRKLGSNDFVGEKRGDKFGTSVDLSADGHRMVVGAPDNLGMANRTVDVVYSGHVRVFEYQEQDDLWIKLGQDIDGDRFSQETARDEGTEAEQAGSVVSISADGTTIAVGANFQAASEDIYDLGYHDGNVKVYRYAESRDEWIQLGNTVNIFQFGLVSGDILESQQQLIAGLSSEKFPVVSRLSGDGNRLAISVLAESLGGAFTGRGAVRLYEMTGDVWSVVGDPIEGLSTFDHSGRSISLSYDGSVVAIGAPQHNVNGLDDGQVRVFALESTASLPTAPPSTVEQPTISPLPTGHDVPITLLLELDFEPELLGWALECGGMLLKEISRGTYGTEFEMANVTETFIVRDGSICKFEWTSPWYFRSYKLFYGEPTNDRLVLDSTQSENTRQNDVSFYVLPTTTSLSFTIQLDAYPRETSWDLRCDGVSFARNPLESFSNRVRFPRVNLLLMGIKDGAVCEFVMEDAFGDGICCNNGVGYYRIMYGDVSGNLLAAGGRFRFSDLATFEVSPEQDPVTISPTLSPSLFPSSTSSPTGDFTTITLFLRIDGSPKETGWSLECNGLLQKSVEEGSYRNSFATITENFLVRVGHSCEFVITDSFGNGLSYTSTFYKVYFGQDTTSDVNLLAEGGGFAAKDVASFVVLPPTQN